jgi:hypothetical protein
MDQHGVPTQKSQIIDSPADAKKAYAAVGVLSPIIAGEENSLAAHRTKPAATKFRSNACCS